MILETIIHALASINDRKSAEILESAFMGFCKDYAFHSDGFGTGEYFSILTIACDVPLSFLDVQLCRWSAMGCCQEIGEINKIPHNHSAFLAPVIEPTMRTTVDSFALDALPFLDRPSDIGDGKSQRLYDCSLHVNEDEEFATGIELEKVECIGLVSIKR